MLQVHSIYSPDGGGSSQAGSPRPRSRSGSDSAFAELDSVPLRVDPARLSCGMHRAITALWALESGGTSWIVLRVRILGQWWMRDECIVGQVAMV